LDFKKLLEHADAILESTPLVRSVKEEIVVAETPKKELKPLLDNFKYNFLGPTNSFPMIIASNLVDA
jgi:hypothetical protein